MGNLNLTTNAKSLILNFEKLKSESESENNKAILKIALIASTLIKERTLKGNDINKTPFKKYSKKTLNHKRSRGGRFFSGKVDLTESGQMLSSMQAKSIGRGSAIIGFTRLSESIKAKKHNLGEGLPKREFFGLSNLDKKLLFNEYEKILKKVIK